MQNLPYTQGTQGPQACPTRLRETHHRSKAGQVTGPFEESPSIDNTRVRVDYQLQDPTFRPREAVRTGLLYEMTPHRDKINAPVRTSLLVFYFGFCFPNCRRFRIRGEAWFGFFEDLVSDYQLATSLEDVFRVPHPVGPGHMERHL